MAKNALCAESTKAGWETIIVRVMQLIELFK